jgi:FMN phosphatase YigB (HAD superfamily)
MRSSYARAELFRGALRAYGFGISGREAREAFHEADLRFAGRVFPFGLPEPAQDAFWSEYQRTMTGRLQVPHTPGLERWIRGAFRSAESRPLDEVYSAHEDALPCIRRLNEAGIKIGALSNSDYRFEEILQVTGLLTSIDTVVDSFRERVAKPDPESFRRALSRPDVRPEESMHVGDLHLFDVLGLMGRGCGRCWSRAETASRSWRSTDPSARSWAPSTKSRVQPGCDLRPVGLVNNLGQLYARGPMSRSCPR